MSDEAPETGLAKLRAKACPCGLVHLEVVVGPMLVTRASFTAEEATQAAAVLKICATEAAATGTFAAAPRTSEGMVTMSSGKTDPNGPTDMVCVHVGAGVFADYFLQFDLPVAVNAAEQIYVAAQQLLGRPAESTLN